MGFVGGDSLTKNPAFFLIGGIFALIIAIGIGRFAYTPIFPFMQRDLLFSNAVAGYLASSNYAGYLVGAVLSSFISWKHRGTFSLSLCLFISILTTLCMGLTNSYVVWFILRFVSGIVSAFVFVLASSIVLDKLAVYGRSSWSGIFYGGVGLGICLSGLLVPIFNVRFGWQGAWIGLAVASVLFGIFVCMWLNKDSGFPVRGNQDEAKQHNPSIKWIPWLVVAYGLEGLGYIVTGTFIVAIAQNIPGFQGDATLVWIAVGLAAAPSCWIWSAFAKKSGFVPALVLAMVIQSMGILIPVIWVSPAGAVMSALLFGATFMGITTLTNTVARQISLSDSSKVIGRLTAIYAAGQMIGPTGAGILSNLTHNYNGALLGAASIVMLGACSLVIGARLDQRSILIKNKLKNHNIN
jgi:MFS family permease